MIRVAIVEDEMFSARRLSEMLTTCDPGVQVMTIVSSVEKFVDWFRADPRPDLIFMDVRLEDDNAFNIFKQVKVNVPVVFTTAYDEYMMQAFQSSGIDYVLKPYDQTKLSAAVSKFKALRAHFRSEEQAQLLEAVKLPEPYKDRFLVTVGTRAISYSAQEVAYFFVNDKVTYLTSKKGNTSPLNHSLEWLEERIDPQLFFRISRRCIVAYDAIVHGSSQLNGRMKLELTPQARFDAFVSGDRVAEFRNWLGK